MFRRFVNRIRRMGHTCAKKVRHQWKKTRRACSNFIQNYRLYGFTRAVRVHFYAAKRRTFIATQTDMADLPYLTTLGQLALGVKMDLVHPQTLNEKLNWLKLNYHHPKITTMVDKATAKTVFTEMTGSPNVIPTYGVWDNFDDITWDTLPDAFVLKCTHDSNSIYIVKNKATMDLPAMRQHFERCLNCSHYLKNREWGYKNITPRILAEAYFPALDMANPTHASNRAVEYKFTCFNGQVVYCRNYNDAAKRNHRNPWYNFYDRAYHHLPWTIQYRKNRYRPEKPAQWEAMVAMSEKCAQGFPYLRVDFYIINEQIYFGEFTFYTCGGFIDFRPRKMDLILGKQLILPAPCWDGDFLFDDKIRH